MDRDRLHGPGDGIGHSADRGDRNVPVLDGSRPLFDPARNAQEIDGQHPPIFERFKQNPAIELTLLCELPQRGETSALAATTATSCHLQVLQKS